MSAWTKSYDRMFGRTLRRFEQTRPDGTFMQVSECAVGSPTGPGPEVWEVLVTSRTGCCEYLEEVEEQEAEALARAEEVDLYADASASDYDDCPNCKH